MKIITLISLIFCLLLCSSWLFFKDSPEVQAELKAKKCFFVAARKIAAKYDIKIAIEGGGLNREGKFCDVTFYFGKKSVPLKVEEARRFIVPIAEDFLAELNLSCKEISDLVVYPLTLENITLGITFEAPGCEEIYSPYVWGVSVLSGVVHYPIEVYVPPQPGVYGKKRKDVNESFEEAKRILDEEKRNSAASSQQAGVLLENSPSSK